MATLGVAAGGAGVGFLLGGPLGASVGWIAGAVVGQILFGSSDDDIIQGAELKDFSVATAYGKTKKKGYGTGRVTLDILWLRGNRFDEVIDEDSSGGKGIGGGTKTRTRRYYATFIAGAGFGPASGVRRLWFDRKLVYDATGTSPVVKRGTLNFVFYPGSETQTVDPDYAADIVDATPMRGEVYLKFLDLPLADYGNRIPNLEAEIVYPITPIQNTTETAPSGITLNAASEDTMSVNYRYNHLMASDTGGSGGVGVNDADTLQQLHYSTPINTQYGLGIDADGQIIGTSGNGFGDNIRIDPISFLTTFSQGAPIQVFSRAIRGFQWATATGIFQAIAGWNTTTIIENATAVRFWTHFDLIFHSDWTPFGSNTRPRGMVERGENTGRMVYKIFDASDASEMHFYQYNITGGVIISFGLGYGIEEEYLGSVSVSDFDVGATNFTIERGCVSHDQSDDSLVTFARLDNDFAKQFVFKWRPGVGVVWKTLLTPPGTAGLLASMRADGSDNRLVGGSYVWQNTRGGEGDPTYEVSLSNGTILQEGAALLDDPDTPGNHAWDDLRGIFWAYGFTTLYKSRVRIQNSSEALIADIYRDRCDIAGIDVDTELDVSAITETVPFYLIDREQSERNNIQPLMTTYRHVAATEDYQLKFNILGGASVFALNESTMEPSREGPPAELTKINDGELPNRVNITFMDINADYASMTQPAQLISDPVNAVYSKVTTEVGLPGGLDVDRARQFADRLLTTSWLERDNYKGRPSLDFIEFTPGLDAGTITRLDGSTQRIRPMDISLGADWSMQASFVAEDSAEFALDTGIVGDQGRYTDQIILADVDSEFFPMNATTLRDEDLTDRTFSRSLWAGSPIRDVPWSGANLLSSPSGGESVDLGSTTTPISWGVLMSVPPADDDYTITNYGSTFTARMVTGFDTLQSVSYLDMLNGANSLYVFDRATGEGEVISFQNFTDLGGTDAQFTDLLRGRRGTNTYLASHAVGDIVVVLDRSAIEQIQTGIANINVTSRYQLVTIGQALSDAKLTDFSYIGQDLKPWTVEQITATINGSDIDLDWVRRTRGNGGLRDGTGTVPLNEDAEEYELEIFDGPGGSIVQPVTGITTSSYKYLNADILNDFGYIPSTLTVKIYQISAQVGRGFSVETTVDVA